MPQQATDTTREESAEPTRSVPGHIDVAISIGLNRKIPLTPTTNANAATQSPNIAAEVVIAKGDFRNMVGLPILISAGQNVDQK